jgi:ubiquinone/menaquinone biosynthesis C-methylase UbiE
MNKGKEEVHDELRRYWHFHMNDKDSNGLLPDCRISEYIFILTNLPEPPKTILDAGCGASLFPSMLSSQGYIVTAMDRWDEKDLSAEGSIGNAKNIKKQTGQEYGIVVGDLLKIPFGDRCFDITICNSTIEHVPNDFLAIRELTRVTKDLIFFTFPTATNSREYNGFDRIYSVNTTIQRIIIPVVENGFKLMPANNLEYDGKILFKREGNGKRN